MTPLERRYYNKRGKMLDRTLKTNVARLSIMWSFWSFLTYTLHFQLKYLYGNIFENTNYCGASDAIAILSGGFIYTFMGGLVPTYYLAFGISTFGGLAILYRENNNTEIETAV
jgi:hypothetical protein